MDDIAAFTAEVALGDEAKGTYRLLVSKKPLYVIGEYKGNNRRGLDQQFLGLRIYTWR